MRLRGDSGVVLWALSLGAGDIKLSEASEGPRGPLPAFNPILKDEVPERAVDDTITTGQIAADLPSVKKPESS